MDYHSVLPNLCSALFLAITPAATTILLFSVMLLFLLSFFISGSEVAFFSLSAKDINVLKTKKQPSFRRIVHLLEQPKTLLASMLITNSFLNIGIILISNLLINNWLSHYAFGFWSDFLIKVIAVTFFLVLFAEVLPKVWATHHKVWFASSASLIVEIFNSLFYRLSKRMVGFTDRIERQVAPEGSASMDNRNLDYAIDLLPEHEASAEEKQILKGIRKFSGTTVKQIMRTRLDVHGIELGATFESVLQQANELHYSRLPVYRNNLDDIAGMLHTKDLLQHLDKPASFDWHSIMRTPYFVHEQKLIEDLLQEFRGKRIHFAIVVDEFGGTSGIVTLEDIMEEIIGDIKDEFDDEESSNRKIDEHHYLFEGKTMIQDVCRLMQLPVDTFDAVRGDSDSLAGLVLEIAGEFPQINEQLVSGDFIFIPLEINKNRIDRVKVIIQPNSTNDRP
ncbi:MAG TPA: gliding motility-associated protein GldE [Ferruginibacter sp.]|nr:gliding motility-associated protein GldE [Ferruginibacter sp.]